MELVLNRLKRIRNELEKMYEIDSDVMIDLRDLISDIEEGMNEKSN